MSENKCKECGRIDGKHFACCKINNILLLKLNRVTLEFEDWDKDRFYINKYKCSNCNSIFYIGNNVKYCPCCSVCFNETLDISL